ETEERGIGQGPPRGNLPLVYGERGRPGAAAQFSVRRVLHPQQGSQTRANRENLQIGESNGCREYQGSRPREIWASCVAGPHRRQFLLWCICRGRWLLRSHHL